MSEEYKEKQRINEYLHAYWEELRGDRPFPAESDIDMEALAPIWGSCFLVKCGKEPDGSRPYTYTYLGQSLIDAYGGENASEKDVCEQLIYPSNLSLTHKFEEVIATNGPVEDEAEFTNAGNMLIKYRSTLLPLSDEFGDIGHIIGGMKWKSF